MSVKNAAVAQANKAAGMAKVVLGTSPVWWADCLDAIHHVAVNQRELTMDDVWERLAASSQNTTREHRSAGPAMKEAHKKGWIEPTRTHLPSERPQRNRGSVRVWRSRIYRIRPSREQVLL